VDKIEYAKQEVVNLLGIPYFYKDFLEFNDNELIEIADCLSLSATSKIKANPTFPLVNEIAKKKEDQLINRLSAENLLFIQKWYWPQGREFAVCLTHDVDKIEEGIEHIMKIKDRFSTLTFIGTLLRISNPYMNIPKIVKIEKELNTKSSFYLLANVYDLNKISKLVEKIKDYGWEIGLHGNFGTHNDAILLKTEKEKLENMLNIKINGVRNHFLKFENPKTWIIQNELKFIYDSTVGFNDEIGFKAGICHPYHPPTNEWNRLGILELPLTIMDATLWGYKKYSELRAVSIFEELLKTIKNYHGLCTILWHQCALKMRGGRIYEKLLRRLAQENVFMTSGIEIAKWWLRREDTSISLKKENKSYVIEAESQTDLEDICLRIIGRNIREISSESKINVKKMTDNEYMLKLDRGKKIKIVVH
jgi:peptidoglycan/xylan/chitin deacetylase (PgdA/CDA1 family)